MAIYNDYDSQYMPYGNQISPQGLSQASDSMNRINPVQTQGISDSSSMQDELAIIQALSRSQGGQQGLGQSIGSLAGTGIGAVYGGPAGAAVGGAVGGGVGSVVDYMIGKDASDRAEQKRIDALRKAKMNQTQRDNANAMLNELANQRSISAGMFGEKMDRLQLAKQMRRNFVSELFGKIAATKQTKESQKQSFLGSMRY